MQQSWQNKVVLITGGSAGLGRAIAAEFAAAGANVAIVGRDVPKLNQTAAELGGAEQRVVAVPGDITRDEDVQRIVEQTLARFGHIDVLVNCAGRSARGKLLEVPLAEFRDLWELNFLATVRMTQACAAELTKSHGQVVNIGSLSSKVATRFLGAYAASKFPVAAFSQQLRLEWANDGVNVLLVCPGPIARDDAGARYAAQSQNLPESARKPGGGVKLKGIRPELLAKRIRVACERREVELVLPWKARVLFALGQLWPKLGDWLLTKFTSSKT